MPSASVNDAILENPYAENPALKAERFLREMNALTAFHAQRCKEYQRILRAAFEGRVEFAQLADLPALPVRLFKEIDLASVPSEQIVRMLTSSGTSGQRPSRIFLDQQTLRAQSRALVQIVRSYLGNQRLPMLILDHPAVLKDGSAFSARGAGVLGFSQFGASHAYALQPGTMKPDWDLIESFLLKHQRTRILLFGFTYIVWLYFLRAAEDSGRCLDFGSSVLIHGGGWKKLEASSVSAVEFKNRLRRCFGIRAIHNYYGMVEQTGSIYMECEEGFFHPSEYSEILIRNQRTLGEQQIGFSGLIETMSSIPRSYPGHVLLTEDMGILRGRDGCRCGRRGSFFTVLGRLAAAELRGCSDTHQVSS